MSDPVREAVDRAWVDTDGGPAYYSSMTDAMFEAAGEALEPVQEWYGRIHTTYEGQDDHESRTVLAMLADLARLIYTTEELADGH